MNERRHHPEAASALLRELDELQPQPRSGPAARAPAPAEDSARRTRGAGRPVASPLASDPWDRAAQWLLAAALAFAPLAFGAVEPWSELVVLALAAAASGCVTVKLVVRREARVVRTWLYLPIFLFAGLVVLQLVPLPPQWVRPVSPNTLALRADLTGVPGGAGGAGRVTLSFYPHATLHDLRLVLAAAAVFVAGVNVLRRPEQIKWMLGVIAVVGGAVAALALAQHLTGAEKIYWSVHTTAARPDGGPFVNHSHFAQFMNLSVGAALGLLLARVQELTRRGELDARRLLDLRYDPDARKLWALGAVIVAGLVAIALSMSRGGVIAAIVSGTLVTLLLALRRGSPGRSSVLAILGVLAFGLLLYFGFDAVYERFASRENMDGGRWQMLKDMAALWRMFPALGTGLGTHEVVFPLVDSSIATTLATHAENEYAQLLEETGWMGLAIVLGFLALVAVQFARAARGGRSVQAASFGLAFGLVAVLVHSLSDFGQHVPANAILSAVCCALLVGLSRVEGGRRKTAAEGPAAGAASAPAVNRWVGVAVVGAVAVALVVLLPGADRARRAEAAWARVGAMERGLARQDWRGGDEAYVALLSAAADAAALQPGNAEYRFRLNYYRWRAITPDTDPETGAAVLPPESFAHAERIVEELDELARDCPTYGDAHLLAGRIELFGLGRAGGARRIRTASRLLPGDADAWALAGELAAAEGRWDEALRAFRRAVMLDHAAHEAAVDLFVNRSDRPDLAVAVAGGNADALLRLADLLKSDGRHPELAHKARAEAVAVLQAACDKDDAPANTLATLADLRRAGGEHAAAVALYRRALLLRPDALAWRLDLARSLADSGDTAEALREAELCLRLGGRSAPVEDLIKRLSAAGGGRPATRGG